MKLKSQDPKIATIIKNEKKRQMSALQMIPSENQTSDAVREAVGSILINKYSEGQPYKRYYQGMHNVDELEALVEKRALKAFGADPEKWHVNVQPYSGSPANAEIFVALLEPNDTIMAMYLSDGGHISHGWSFKDKPLSLSAKFFNIEYYHVEEKTSVFNYAEVERIAKKTKPKIIVSGGTAYPRDINHKKLGSIAKKVGAYYLADISHEAGLVASGVLNSPFDHADVVMCTTHKTLRGPRGALIFARKELIAKIDKAVFPGMQGGPHNHTIAGIGVALKEAMKPSFKTYAKRIIENAQALSEALTQKGFTIVTGGTDKHLVLIDLRDKQLSGKIAAIALEYAGIVCNANTVPYDSGPPLYPSGLRLGTPWITTIGLTKKDMKRIANWIYQSIEEIKDYSLPDDPKKRKQFVEHTTKELSKNKALKKISNEVILLLKKKH